MSDAVARPASHQHCFLCGDHDSDSLQLRFMEDGAGGVYAWFQGHPRFQGYTGILHGGMIAALLDSAMTHCLFARGIAAVTGDLQVRYRLPVPCAARVEIRAQLLSETKRYYRLRSDLLGEGGARLAWAKATFADINGRRGRLT